MDNTVEYASSPGINRARMRPIIVLLTIPDAIEIHFPVAGLTHCFFEAMCILKNMVYTTISAELIKTNMPSPPICITGAG